MPRQGGDSAWTSKRELKTFSGPSLASEMSTPRMFTHSLCPHCRVSVSFLWPIPHASTRKGGPLLRSLLCWAVHPFLDGGVKQQLYAHPPRFSYLREMYFKARISLGPIPRT